MAAIVGFPTQSEPNIIPDYEVRLLLNPTAVLGPEHELTSTVLSAFHIAPTVTRINVQFLDKGSKEIYLAGWSARIRKAENENDFELTYKKRYPIVGCDVDTALTAANNDGLNARSTKYKAQVEWGYQKQTLSISRKKTVMDTGVNRIDLPDTPNSRKMLIDEAPDKFDNFGSNKWGTGALAVSRIFGPVLVRRSTGLWKGMQLYFETWPLLNSTGTGIEYIVEASFKTTSRMTASVEQTNLAAYLESQGWLLAEDSLKTQLIMERY
ncbi:uncharacterized protein N7473_003912 [Penicillium subrubescens]|jgi:hypothetical protein|uniref:Uncharacterized protein n=1 Tax=Penicillium subrubescens TaxID=1316194 RepID=A0A1Q5UBL9_9EURO|nr:uncharacterized protein N7473_003912 [Penicillium subrubescens]KAJ5906996.1 hypothetical protein N7473_003912 [Penicillium subrubescens]OKP09850.1 hypothetical protein PENSUB_4774 [Penicillium subrubescens]